MRRMLDPKTIGGGGGGAKIYCHCIELRNRNGDNYISFNFFSESKDKFTLNSLKDKLTGKKKIACSGYVVKAIETTSSNLIPNCLTTNSSNTLICRVKDVTNRTYLFISIDDYDLTDTII